MTWAFLNFERRFNPSHSNLLRGDIATDADHFIGTTREGRAKVDD
jgi:hypothetical protein